MRDVVHLDHRELDRRKLDGRVVRIRRRIEIEGAGHPIEIPLSGHVDLREKIDGVIGAVLAIAVAVIGRRQGDLPLVRVDRSDLFMRVGPTEVPIAVQPRVAVVLPTPGAIAFVGESAGLAAASTVQVVAVLGRDVDHADIPLVRPSRKCHRPAVEEQLHGRMGLEAPPAAEPSQAKRLELTDAVLLDVDLHHMAARLLGQPRQDGRVADGLESLEPHPAGESGRLALAGTVDDRSGFGARVARAEFERLRHGILPPAHAYLDATGRQSLLPFQPANLPPRAIEGCRKDVPASPDWWPRRRGPRRASPPVSDVWAIDVDSPWGLERAGRPGSVGFGECSLPPPSVDVPACPCRGRFSHTPPWPPRDRPFRTSVSASRSRAMLADRAAESSATALGVSRPSQPSRKQTAANFLLRISIFLFLGLCRQGGGTHRKGTVPSFRSSRVRMVASTGRKNGTVPRERLLLFEAE